MAVVGLRGRGQGLIDAVAASSSAHIVALADVDQKVLAAQSPDDRNLFRTNDFRRILDRPDVDAIVSATPNHWHALLTVWACQAGKHVYIEKPISHNMFESQAVVAAADRSGKLVQCGYQNRSDSGLTDFYQRLQQGEFGKVTSVHGTCHRPRKSIGRLDQPLNIPSHIDYDLWLGPAADQPLYRPNLHYDWHWDFNTGNGDVGNQGPHEWDLMNWALGDNGDLPNTIQVSGNRFGWNDAGNTPNVMACRGTMSGIPFAFEVMDLQPGCQPPHNQAVGVIIETEQGRFVGGRGGGKFIYQDGTPLTFKRDASQSNQDGTRAHMQNFFDAVLKNDRSLLHSDCRVAARSSSMAHMANISYQLASVDSPKEIRKAIARTPSQRDMIDRLLQANTIYQAKHPGNQDESWRLGPELQFDNESQQFQGPMADQANGKMARTYRSNFRMPQLSG